MIYKYDKNLLQFRKISWITNVLRLFGVLFTTLILLSLVVGSTTNQSIEPEVEIMLILNEHNKFNEEKFVDMIRSLNFRFPHIVYAQSKLETGNFTSRIFKENNNLFGMREAVVRLNTAKGTQYNHAYYDNWKESVFDYALYSSTYLSKLRTEDTYFEYLSQNYAENPEYVSKLKFIIKNEKLDELF